MRPIPTDLSWNVDFAETMAERGVGVVQATAPIVFPDGDARLLNVYSGVQRLPVRGVWSPVLLRIEFALLGEPRVGLVYTVEFDADTVHDVAGQTVRVPAPRSFRLEVAPAPGAWHRDAAPPPDFAREIEPLLARCAPCHAQHDGLRFTHDALVLRRSASEPARYLVEPGEPAESALLLRMLDAYTDEGRLMPPYWSDVAPLTTDELLRIEEWIRAGAR